MNPEPPNHPPPVDCNPPAINRKAVRRTDALKRAKTKPAPDRNRTARAKRRK